MSQVKYLSQKIEVIFEPYQAIKTDQIFKTKVESYDSLSSYKSNDSLSESEHTQILIPGLNPREVVAIDQDLKDSSYLGTDKMKKIRFLKKNKRGRNITKGTRKSVNDRNSSCNIELRYLHKFLDFIIIFMNILLSEFECGDKFENILKDKVSPLKKIKEESISQILDYQNVKGKGTNCITNLYHNHNKELKKEIESNIIDIKNILSENFITFFNKYFTKNYRVFDLNEYGIEKIIQIPKEVIMLKDIFEKEEFQKKVLKILIKKFGLKDKFYTSKKK